MTKKKKPVLKELKKIADQGIQVDIDHLRRDMCSQFTNRDLWIREYVVNAFDAKATRCSVFGRETDDRIIIYIRDNGLGMDRQTVKDYFHLFRSRKIDREKAIGRFGIGKLAVAAIDEQCGFEFLTSTGREAFRAKTGSLLSNDPIHVEQLVTVPERGTEFCISFQKKTTFRDFMRRLSKVLIKHLRFLPMDIEISMPSEHEDEDHQTWTLLTQSWEPITEVLSRRFTLQIDGASFDIVMTLGSGIHELYQNRVYVTNQYDLLTHNTDASISIPHLDIRVDSPALELPFSRDSLCNESILDPLTRTIRNNLLPKYFEELAVQYNKSDTRGSITVIEEITTALCLSHFGTRKPWMDLPVLRKVDGKRISLSELKKSVRLNNKLYMSPNENTGVDYSLFDGPVMSTSQPKKGLEVLKENFSDIWIDLNDTDAIFEAPDHQDDQLSPSEKRFQNALGFHPNVLSMKKDSSDDNTPSLSEAERERMSGIRRQMSRSSSELQSIRWRVSKLVQRDGKTPCSNYRFIYRNRHVILNLNHPDIRKLVDLSQKSAELSGHWAMALCLTENNAIMPHLSAEAREDLLLVDAMSKLDPKNAAARPVRKRKVPDEEDRAYWNFFRNAQSF